MKVVLFIYLNMLPLLLFCQEKENSIGTGGIRFTNFQSDHRNVVVFDASDEIVEEVFVPEYGQGVLHDLKLGEYCAKVYILPQNIDDSMVNLDSKEIYETEFSFNITSSRETRVLLQQITKHLLSKEVD